MTRSACRETSRAYFLKAYEQLAAKHENQKTRKLGNWETRGTAWYPDAITDVGGTAQAGDAAEGEKTFKRSKSCHAIIADNGTRIIKGGKTGPNLYGVFGRTVGTLEGFTYGKSMAAAGAAGLVWDA